MLIPGALRALEMASSAEAPRAQARGPGKRRESSGDTLAGPENKCIHIQTNGPIAPGWEREHPIGWREVPGAALHKAIF